ncbi:fimbrial protein, partial [Cronobacter sakazakii]|uniref:fimbrial protein n=1 Tax=Cronobacter sakazakii TaxID=28141 RepID=UPI003C1300BE
MTRLTCYAIALTLGIATAATQASPSARPASEFDIGLKGPVNMQGTIVSKACDIAMESRYQSIEMPDESVNVIKRAGEGVAMPFSIHLV